MRGRGSGRGTFVRYSVVVVLSAPLAILGACTSSFSTINQGGGGDDAGDENPGVQVVGGGDAGPDGTTGAGTDAGHHDAAPETGPGTSEAGDVGAPEAEAAPPGCSNGDLDCSGTCVPNDVHNCGTCGHDCTNLPHVAGAATCSAAGACTFTAQDCAAGWADCNGNPDDGCEQDITGPDHCGSCTNACAANDPVCSGGTCVTGCGALALCSGSCVDTTSNPNDCNGCGNVCPSSLGNAQPTCANSACSYTCNGGFTGCPNATSPTSCVDEQSDPNNCGACNHACPPPTSGAGVAACSGGGCTLDCNAGLTACPTAAPTECANTTNDTSNCGSCGHMCPAPPQNATESCAASTCVFTCNNGFQECNSNSCIPDADTTNGAFVSPSGSGSACTAAQPCATIAAAIATAKTIIYLDKGTYTETVELPTAATLAIHGGWSFSAGSWTNCDGTNATSIISAPADTAVGYGTGVSQTGGTWTLDTLTLEDEATPVPGGTLYGVFLSAGGLSMTNVAIVVAGGGDAGPVAQGANGNPAPSSCGQGSSTVGAAGTPGTPGTVGAGDPQGGYYAENGFIANDGAQGAPGQPGGNGGPGYPAPTDAGAPFSESCGYFPGTAGCSTSCCAVTTTAGQACGLTTACGTQTPPSGAVGCGGGGGSGGYGGNPGGASIGIFVSSGATVTVSAVTITTGAGGHGGAGGLGGNGATGSTPAVPGVQTATACAVKKSGSSYECNETASQTLPAGQSSTGGAGGNGGQGGGGAGGDSVCYASDASPPPVTGVPTCNAGGAGGGGSPGGATGRSGLHN